MTPQKLRIWNDFNWERVSPKLRDEALARHDFVQGANHLANANIAFGQPDPAALQGATNLRWLQLTSAGYTPYDRDDLKVLFAERGIIMTNSSAVYAEPCAQHLLAMMLGLARRLPQAVENQRGAKAWNQREQRQNAFLLMHQKVLLLGYGAIAQRLTQMLQPFDLQIFALRRSQQTAANVTIIHPPQLSKVLSEVDHVVNILPESKATRHFVNEQFLAAMKPGAVFYNIGRGATVDQNALIAALHSNRLGAACLDVTSPEPLPPDDPLWSAPNCYITPHSGGGHKEEYDRLLRHFCDNLNRWEKGETLANRVY